jgi:hypothetical protein
MCAKIPVDFGHVFYPPSSEPTSRPKEFALMEHMASNDELVHPVEDGLPRLRFTRALAGHKSLVFEGLSAGAYLEAFADSRTSHS